MTERLALEGKTALITGGGGGIGRGIADGFARAGAHLVLTGRSENANIAAQEMTASGASVTAIQCDVADRDDLEAMFATTLDRLGHLDVLVNCHGTAVASPTVDHDLDAWDHTLEVNLTSVFSLCRLAGTHMLERGSGKIINIASMYFFFGGLNVVSYSASKGGVAQLTKALSNEWAGRGLNVNAIAPGYIRTELNRHIWQDEARSSEILGRIPADRWGEPEDMAEPAVFLASDAARYIHGIVLPVDGGFMAR